MDPLYKDGRYAPPPRGPAAPKRLDPDIELLRRMANWKPIPFKPTTRKRRIRLQNAIILPFPEIPKNWRSHEEQVREAFRESIRGWRFRTSDRFSDG